MSELIEVEVYSYEDPTEMLALLDARLLPSALEELRGNGGGDFALNIHDPKLVSQPNLLDSRNVVKFKVNGKYVGAQLLGKSAKRYLEDDDATEIYKLSGEGLRGWMNDASVHPQGGLKKTSFNERFFNFATPRGDWYDPDQWTTPVNIYQWGDVVNSYWRYAPAEWPDAPLAQWVWGQSYTTTAPAGDNFFRLEFTSDEDAKYSFFLGADDQYSLYIDGQLVEQSDIDATPWTQTNRTDFELLAGDHVIGVRVTAKAGPAGLLAALYRFGDPTVPSSATLLTFTGLTLTIANARLTTATARATSLQSKWAALPAGPAKDQAYAAWQMALLSKNMLEDVRDQMVAGDMGWYVSAYPDPLPGWSPGEIVLTLLAEAEARDVRFPLWLTPTFTSTHDTYGNEWPRDLDWSFGVGESLSSVVERLEELVCDLWIDPETLELNMAIERGVDRSVYGYAEDGITVNRPILTFEVGKNLIEASIDEVGEIKNSLLLQTIDGWTSAQDDDSKAKYGAIEALLDTGSSEAISQALADSVFAMKANPEVGASYEIVPFPGHIPWVDFQVGDWVLAPDARGILVKRRVMSISVEEDDNNGEPVYTVEFDTIFRDNEDKLSRWMEKLGGGTLGGQFANSGGGSVSPIGQPTIPPPTPTLLKFPVAVDGLTVSSIGLWATNGVDPFSEAHLEWNPVIINTDGSPTVPAFYEVWGRPTELSDNTYSRLAVTTDTEADVRSFATGSSWTFRVRAMNDANSPGGYSDAVEHTMEAPDTPMEAPDTPSLSSSNGILVVSWNGLLDGAAPPNQFRYVYAQVSPAGDNTWVTMGPTLSRDGRNIYISGLTITEDYDVRLIAVDGLGLETDPSGTATQTIIGVDLGDLDPSVEAAIDAAAEAARLARGTTNMLSDPSFEANDPTLWSLETVDVTNVTTTPRTGSRVLRIDAAAAPYTASRYGLALEVDQGEQYLVSAWLRALGSGSSVNEGIKLCVEYGDDNTTSDGVSEVTGSPEVDTTWVKFEDVWTVPIGARYARVRIDVEDDGNTNSYLIDDMSMRMLIPNALIVDGAISADKIGAGEVIAGKLAAGSVAAENIQAGAVTAGKIEAGSITANEIAASTITGDLIEAGTIKVTNLDPAIGDDINLNGNVTIISAFEAIDGVQSDVDGVDSNLQEMQTYYSFGPDGAIISTPDSPYSLRLANDRISIRELGNEVSYWNAGTMYVRSFVGEEVILGNHKIEKYGDGTVVRIL